MKQFYAILLTASLTLISQFGLSQQLPIQLELTTNDSLTVPNGLVDVEVRVSDFENILATQFVITWDSLVLEITDIPYISPDLSGLSLSSFALPEQTDAGTKGQLAHAWLPLDAAAKSLPDDHHLFTMRFKAIGPACSLTSFGFLEIQNIKTIEILNADFEDIGAEINEQSILVTGPGCDGFIETVACNDFINVSLSPWGLTEITADMILEGGPYDYSVMQVDPPTLDCENIGVPVVVTVTNTNNGVSCWGEVLVEDRVPPVVVLEQQLIVSLSPSNSANPFTATVFVEDLDEGSYDACSDELVFSPTQFDFDCSQVGPQDLVVTVTDEYGNVNSAFTTVIVEIQESVQLSCPLNVVVACETDIEDEDIINNVLGAATSASQCTPIYEDFYGYDQNNDGDRADEYTLNGVTITEEYYACGYGTILRVWRVPGAANSCQQIIGLENTGSTFDGSTMIDWPYSLDAITSVQDNDGRNCAVACGPDQPSNIELIYDQDGNPIGANITSDCSVALCEEPFWEESGCSFIGWGYEEEVTDLGNGVKNVVKTYSVIDACSFDEQTGEGKWSWTVNATIDTGIPDEVTLALSDVSGAKGETVCLPLRVFNFQNIESIQASVNWDPNVAQFNSIGGFGLPGLGNGSFGINSVDEGKLSFVWFDDTTNSPATLQDGSSLFELCFNVVGDQGESTLVEVSNEPTRIEITSEARVIPYATITGSLIVGESNCDNDFTPPVPYCVNLSTALLDDGEVELWAIDFDAGSFDNCSASEDLRFTFSDVNPDNDPDFVGSSSSRTYTTQDLTGSVTIVEVPVYVWDESDNKDFCLVQLTLMDDPSNDNIVEFSFEDYYGAKDNVLCTELKVDNFTEVEAVQATITWDTNILNYTGVSNAILPNFSTAANVNEGNVENGILPFIWFDNSVSNPVSFADGATLFEVCFELVGEEGDVSPLELVDSPTLIQVSSTGVGARPYIVHPGSVTILDGTCAFDESDIQWPASELSVFVDGVNSSNISDLMSPNALVNIEGIDSTDVFPEVMLEEFCQNLIGVSWTDSVFEEGNDQFRIVRVWVLLDWFTAQQYSFTQVIRNYAEGGLICDFLPNSAPLGDCASGHTLDDDIEWPDDVNISDHRITPDELFNVLGVDFDDTRPIFTSNENLYTLTYVDFLGTLSQTELQIEREWILVRNGIVGQSWSYIQNIYVDLTDFGKLVTVQTDTYRPVPDVVLNSSATTNLEGIAYTEDDVNPVRLDESHNGLNIRDMMLLWSQVVGNIQFESMELLAADVNLDATVSTIDIIEMERIILDYDSPWSTEWLFLDETDQSTAGVAPKGHYIAYKPGDIDDSADLGVALGGYMSETLFIEDRLLNAGEIYEIPMYISGNIEAMATELHLLFDKDKVEIKNVTSEQSFDEVSYNIINGDRLSMVTKNEDLSGQVIDSINAFITLEIEALENGTLKNVFGISDTRESFILDNSFELILIEDLFENEITTSTEDLLLSDSYKVYPNPVMDFITVECNICAEGAYIFELYSMDGRKLIAEPNATRVDLSNLQSGLYNYLIRNSEGVQPGKIIKVQ